MSFPKSILNLTADRSISIRLLAQTVNQQTTHSQMADQSFLDYTIPLNQFINHQAIRQQIT